MIAQPAETHYLCRQPILDRTQNLTGFALCLRPVDPRHEQDVTGASDQLRYAFAELGADGVLGRHKGALKISPELLMSEAIDSLPADRLMLTLSNADGLSPETVARCQALRRRGFTLAAESDLLGSAHGTELLKDAQLIRLDVTGLDADSLSAAVSALRPSGRRLLACGVESPELAHQCLQLGVDYLQGNFFARPHIAPGAKLDHGQRALMGLLGLILSDADLDEVVDAFKHYPDMSLQLLRLANSAAVGARGPATSIAQAVTVMGRNAMRRWLQVLMFSSGDAVGVEYPSPLLIQAATRGKLMELITRDILGADRTAQDDGFMTGMLSLLSAQFGVEIDQLIEGLPLTVEARSALLERGGQMGVVLFLVESLEQPGFVDIHMAMDGIGVVDTKALMSLQVAAMNWANTLDTGSTRRTSL